MRRSTMLLTCSEKARSASSTKVRCVSLQNVRMATPARDDASIDSLDYGLRLVLLGLWCGVVLSGCVAACSKENQCDHFQGSLGMSSEWTPTAIAFAIGTA